MRTKIRLVAIVIGGLALAALVLYQATGGLKVPVMVVQPETITNTLEEEGKLVPATEHSIHAVYGAEVLELAVEEGQHVQKGELLAIIDATELKFQLQQLQAQLKTLRGEEAQAYQTPPDAQIKSQELLVEQARQNLAMAETDLDRVKQLYQAEAVTAKELEDAKSKVASAKLTLQQQEESLALLHQSHHPTKESQQFYAGRRDSLNAQANLLQYQIEKCRLQAPTTGIVANLAIKAGDLVNPGLRLMTIFQPEPLLVETYVAADEVEGINLGMPTQLTLRKKGQELSFPGKVKKIAPTAVEMISALGLEEQRVKITVKPDLPGNVQLLPGTTLDVELITDKQEGVLVIPKAALFPYGNGDAIWVVDKDKASIQPVKTGLKNNSQVVITQGLQEGDVVILNPQATGLKEGKKISSGILLSKADAN